MSQPEQIISQQYSHSHRHPARWSTDRNQWMPAAHGLVPGHPPCPAPAHLSSRGPAAFSNQPPGQMLYAPSCPAAMPPGPVYLMQPHPADRSQPWAAHTGPWLPGHAMQAPQSWCGPPVSSYPNGGPHTAYVAPMSGCYSAPWGMHHQPAGGLSRCPEPDSAGRRMPNDSVPASVPGGFAARNISSNRSRGPQSSQLRASAPSFPNPEPTANPPLALAAAPHWHPVPPFCTLEQGYYNPLHSMEGLPQDATRVRPATAQPKASGKKIKGQKVPAPTASEGASTSLHDHLAVGGSSHAGPAMPASKAQQRSHAHKAPLPSLVQQAVGHGHGATAATASRDAESDTSEAADLAEAVSHLFVIATCMQDGPGNKSTEGSV